MGLSNPPESRKPITRQRRQADRQRDALQEELLFGGKPELIARIRQDPGDGLPIHLNCDSLPDFRLRYGVPNFITWYWDQSVILAIN